MATQHSVGIWMSCIWSCIGLVKGFNLLVFSSIKVVAQCSTSPRVRPGGDQRRAILAPTRLFKADLSSAACLYPANKPFLFWTWLLYDHLACAACRTAPGTTSLQVKLCVSWVTPGGPAGQSTHTRTNRTPHRCGTMITRELSACGHD